MHRPALIKLGRIKMIELDNGPVAIIGITLIAFLLPVLYSFFVDKNAKD